MKVAILGSGNGACAMAFEWARAGHDIYMYDLDEVPNKPFVHPLPIITPRTLSPCFNMSVKS